MQVKYAIVGHLKPEYRRDAADSSLNTNTFVYCVDYEDLTIERSFTNDPVYMKAKVEELRGKHPKYDYFLFAVVDIEKYVEADSYCEGL